MLGWGSPDAYGLAGGYGVSIFEDEASGNLYQINTTGGLKTAPVAFDENGVYLYSPSWIMRDASFAATSEALTPPTGKPYIDNVAITYPDGGKVATFTITAGAISATHSRTLSTSFYLQPRRIQAGAFYAASATGISKLDMAMGVETQPITAAGVTDFEVLADQLFFSTASGTYQYDSVSTTTTPYTGGEVVPVSE